MVRNTWELCKKARWEILGKSFPAYGCQGTIKDKDASQFFDCFPSIHFCMANPVGDLHNEQGQGKRSTWGGEFLIMPFLY